VPKPVVGRWIPTSRGATPRKPKIENKSRRPIERDARKRMQTNLIIRID
jgi:hypothetical protein